MVLDTIFILEKRFIIPEIHKKMMKQRSLVSRSNRLQLICFIKAATSLDTVNSAMSWLSRLFANCTAVIRAYSSTHYIIGYGHGEWLLCAGFEQ